MFSRSLLIVAAVAVFSTAQADTIYVDDDNCPGPGSGTKGDPYCSIQTAIDNAVDTDEIVVAPGTYNELIDFLGKAIWLHSSDGPDVTIIDGTGLYIRVVGCWSGEGPDTVLDGFTITSGIEGGMYNWNSNPTVTNCTFSGNSAEFGGGMVNDNSSPTVTDCTFSDNGTSNSGGGMANFSSSPAVTNCTFSGNSAIQGMGGGMYNYQSNPIVSNCTFSGNSAGDGGGGMGNVQSNPTVANCSFSGNSAGDDGGGMNNNDSSPTVSDCTFTDNSAVFRGGGMYNNLQSSLTVTTCTTFTGNVAGSSGGGIESAAGLTVNNCTVSSNLPNDIVAPSITTASSACSTCIADLDGDSTVGITDFLTLLGVWGPCP